VIVIKIVPMTMMDTVRINAKVIEENMKKVIGGEAWIAEVKKATKDGLTNDDNFINSNGGRDNP
jgi:hypothetical protein